MVCHRNKHNHVKNKVFNDGDTEFLGKLPENVMYFGRTLRAAGIPIGSGQIVEALKAVSLVGVQNRTDFYWTLHSVFISRNDQKQIFDQAFEIFWKNPHILERMMQLVVPNSGLSHSTEEPMDVSRRVSDVLYKNSDEKLEDYQEPDIEVDATLTWSPGELLAEKDFETMSAAEIVEAKAAIKELKLPIIETPTRRYQARHRGDIVDMRRTFRLITRSYNGYIPIVWRARKYRRPPLVIICDISGSMEQYSRMMLHFMHAVTNDRDRVYTFLFGTRLTNVTRYLRYKDIDVALAKLGKNVLDWSGGTRIGACLYDFNKNWSRRVCTQGAITIIISDGLDRDEGTGLGREMERIHKASRRLIWLNPLLRYDRFEPKSHGIKAMLPHVDQFKTVHNLNSLKDLAVALSV